VCHDILGQTALVDLAGLRDAIAGQRLQAFASEFLQRYRRTS